MLTKAIVIFLPLLCLFQNFNSLLIFLTYIPITPPITLNIAGIKMITAISPPYITMTIRPDTKADKNPFIAPLLIFPPYINPDVKPPINHRINDMYMKSVDKVSLEDRI